MNSEIVPAADNGVNERSSSCDTGGEDWKALGWVLSLGVFPVEYFGALDLLGLCAAEKTEVEFRPSDGYYEYETELNPTPDFVRGRLEVIRKPLLMFLRGCDQLSLQYDFHFEKFKTLTALEISGFTKLITTLPDQAISELTQLKHLNLSHLPIKHLQDDFFSNLRNLRSLVLSGCSELQSLPKFPQLEALEFLDLSRLPIEALPEGCFYNLKNLHRVILRGCSNLSFLPSTEPMQYLQALDLAFCTTLPKLGFMQLFLQPNLERLDLSCTEWELTHDILSYTNFSHLYLRCAEVTNLNNFACTGRLKVLDLAGAHYIKGLHLLSESQHLVAVDLSRTGIESVDFISDVVHLRYLILRECTMLERLPALERLTELEVLDLSGCEMLVDLPEDLSSLDKLKELNLSGCSRLGELREGVFDKMSCLEKLDLSKTNIENHIPSVANLTNLRTLNLSHTSVETVPGWSSLVNLEQFLFGSIVEMVSTRTTHPLSECTPYPSEFHLGFSDNKNEISYEMGGYFDVFREEFGKTVALFSTIQQSYYNPTKGHTTGNTVDEDVNATNAACFDGASNPDASGCTTNEDLNATNVAKANIISSQIFQRNYESMLTDLYYIRDNIDLLKSSPHCSSANILLQVVGMATNSKDYYGFSPGSTNLIELFRTVAKLKLLVPRKQVVDDKGFKLKFRRVDSETKLDPVYHETDLHESYRHTYDSLTVTQRNCLLYFSAFPTRRWGISMKEKTLVQLWYGEGFIDPTHDENIALSEPNPIENPQSTTPNENQNPDQVLLQVSTTIEEKGRQVLMVLREKGFINENHEAVIWEMDAIVCSFVKAQAEAERFFDLTPHLTGSKRACLMRDKDGLYPSSCKLWARYTNSSENLQRFKTIRTLFNADETVVDIKPEWFSKMRNLSVLHIGNWDYESIIEDFINEIKVHDIEVVDFMFLEELKYMKQLRLLNMVGILSFAKLSDAICKLTNLRVLNLRGCGYLEELPVGIGSLKNLTHLDLTDCHVLSKLPKGLRFLSKLEVLKGFVIFYQIGGRQHRDACTFKDLVNLEKLRKLALVVSTEKFPGSKDLRVFKEMKNLCNLKITWTKNYNKDYQASHDVIEKKALKQMKFWEQRKRKNDTNEPSTSNPLDNLRKLVMCCFPLHTAPSWLHPSGLQKLEKLYIFGGELESLAGDTNQMNTWNVKSLKLTYLKNMDTDWEVLRCNFPRMTYLKTY